VSYTLLLRGWYEDQSNEWMLPEWQQALIDGLANEENQ
jgi:hypothetical protein